MKVIVTGATGNVGTSVIEALSEAPQVDEAVGLARRRPTWEPPKTSWVDADIVSADLVPIFAGADAVIHLAWAIQPSRDELTLERINIDGSRRVFEAVVAAGVPRLVHASSVGAYAPGPKDQKVDEDWPLEATGSSFYSRHKVAVERMLDGFERANPGLQVVRLRPALIFKGDAATEIRRFFVGPFLPSFLVRPNLVPLVPRIARLRFQAVHSADVGRAYMLAASGEARGAFNIAAEPPLGPDELAQVFNARTFPLPAVLARGITDLSWRLRLQPTPPGWLDMALNVPLMSSARAIAELGWAPRHSAIDALEELLAGIRKGRGRRTPPLEEAGLGGRVEEIRTGVGARQWRGDGNNQLLDHLTDVHSIEEQALAQMRSAPGIAGDERLTAAFERQREETEGHERLVRERIEALAASPSTVKDLAGRGGGYAALLFAGAQPDTPGKLATQAYSYEHMEIAACESLRRLAKQAGDEQTAALADRIGADDREMAARLRERFDLAADASLSAVEVGGIEQQLIKHLADAHALERQAEQLLESGPELVEDEALQRIFREHLEQTRNHKRRIEERLRAHGASPSLIKDAAMRAGGVGLGGFFGAQPDTAMKLAGFAFAFEHLEIAAYEMLRRVAERAGDAPTAATARQTLAEEQDAARKLAATWERPA